MSAPGTQFVVVDASVWVSRLVQIDVFHLSVKVWMQTQREQGITFLSPALLLPEVAGAISRRTGDKQLAMRSLDRLQNLPGLRLVELGQPIIEVASRIAAELGLRGADSIYVAVATQLNLPLVTLDADQRERAASIISIHFLEDNK
jgi:predicted nucleic acid-binding protein